MDGDGGRATCTRGRYKIRAVQNVERKRSELHRHCKALEAMMAGRPKFLYFKVGLVDEECPVLAALKKDKFIFLIESCQRLSEPQDVLANTSLVVKDEAPIDPDAH